MELRALYWPAGATEPADDLLCATKQAKVVLIHGLGDTADIWRPVMRHLNLPCGAIAIDLPGHGRSHRLKHEGGISEELRTSVFGAMKKAGVHRPILVGHSLGAHLCASLASQPDVNPDGTILIDPSARRDDAVAEAMLEHIDKITTGAETVQELIKLYCDRIPLSDSVAVSSVVTAMAVLSGGRWQVPLDSRIRRLITSQEDEDIWSVLPKLKGPVELVRGAFSAVLPQHAAERMITLVRDRPRAVRVIQMASHAICLQQPSDLAKVLDFCIRGMMK